MIRLILVLICFAKAINGASDGSRAETSGNELICNTSECNEMSEFIRSNMDSSIEACDNFYSHTCNPKNRTFRDKVTGILHGKLTELIQGTSPVDRNTERIRKFYKSCLKSDSKEVGKLILALRTHFQKVKTLDYSWSDVLLSVAREGFGDGQLFEVGWNLRQSKLELKPANFSYLDSSDRKQKIDYLLSLIEPSRKYTKTDNDDEQLDKVDLFIGTLLTGLKAAGSEQVEFDLEELSREYNNIPWPKLLSSSMNHKVEKQVKISVIDPAYFERLNRLVSIEDSRTLTDVMLIDVLAKFGSILDDDLAQLTGYNAGQCVDTTIKHMSLALMPSIAKHIIGLDKIQQIYEMADQLKATFSNMIRESDMIANSDTRYNAIRKITYIRSHIVCPKELLNDTLLNELYYGNEMHELSLKDNIQNHNIIYYSIKLKSVGRDWEQIIDTIQEEGLDMMFYNAYYGDSMNFLYVFPSYVNQFVVACDTNYIRYGILGSTIGHEMAHSLDSVFRHYNEHGDLTYWWDLKSNNTYNNRLNHFYKQYGSCNKSLQEDVTDQMGTLVAYKAYSEWLESSGCTELKLAGLDDYTDRQMFWISLANMWCGSLDLGCATHSPPKLRVNEPLKNYIEFSDDFGCESDQAMNPADKCVVW